MAKVPIISFTIDEINYFIQYFVNHISEYKLSELTNNYMGDIPSIQNVHPLAIEYGNMMNADNEGNYTSILPAIGVELINDNESGQQLLGSGKKQQEITTDYLNTLEAIQIKDRFSSGTVLANTNLEALKIMKTAKGTEKLWSSKSTYFQNIQLAVSIWSDNFDVTRRLYIVVRDLLKRIKHDISVIGVKNVSIQGQGAIYNFEFNTTLFGAEFTITFTNFHYQQEVDDSLTTIKSVDESIISPNIASKPTFKGVGE
jgi:hypothetical protein